MKCDKCACNRNLSGSFETLKIIQDGKNARKSRFVQNVTSKKTVQIIKKKFNNTNLQGSIEKEKEEVGTSDDKLIAKKTQVCFVMFYHEA